MYGLWASIFTLAIVSTNIRGKFFSICWLNDTRHPKLSEASLSCVPFGSILSWVIELSECNKPKFTRIGSKSLYCKWFQFSSVAQSCPTLCNPMICRTPGLPVHHQLPEFTQTHIHRVSDTIQPSHPLSSPSPPAPNPSQHQSFPISQFFAWGGQSPGVSALASFLPKKSQGWSPSEWTGWISALL